MTLAMFVLHSALIYGAYYMVATWDSYGML